MYKPWPMHHVCRHCLIANSLNAADVNGDGFDDYLVVDERRGLMTIVIHPGKTGDVRREWPRLVLGQTGNPEYACLGDVDGDGALDIVVGGRRHPVTKQYAGLRWLRAPTDRTTRRDLSKWTSHFLDPDTPSGHGFVFADLNGDGRLDLVGALIHNDGHLPKDKASVFWLENNGGAPDTWNIYPIEWSDGANTRDPWIGEKWDHLIPLDVDGDGDLDLLGNVEEHYHRGSEGKDVSWFSVVWFENPLK